MRKNEVFRSFSNFYESKGAGFRLGLNSNDVDRNTKKKNYYNIVINMKTTINNHEATFLAKTKGRPYRKQNKRHPLPIFL